MHRLIAVYSFTQYAKKSRHVYQDLIEALAVQLLATSGIAVQDSVTAVYEPLSSAWRHHGIAAGPLSGDFVDFMGGPCLEDTTTLRRDLWLGGLCQKLTLLVVVGRGLCSFCSTESEPQCGRTGAR